LWAGGNGWFFRFFSKGHESVAGGRRLWYIRGVVTAGGYFLVGAKEGGLRVELLVDTGAQVCLAPLERRDLLRPSSAAALKLSAFNGTMTVAAGVGQLTMVFTGAGANATAEDLIYRLPVAAPRGMPPVQLALLGRSTKLKVKKRDRVPVLTIGCPNARVMGVSAVVPQGVWVVGAGVETVTATGAPCGRASACKPLRTAKELLERYNVTSAGSS
jgi:hypothetical protein